MRPCRPGVTLVEVLVAIFIMGVGMLAILVLFPLGALNMARALKDDRCGAIAANADSMAQGMGLRSDPNIVGSSSNPPPNVAANIPSLITTAPAGYPAPDPNGPSYPVFVDPYYAPTATAPATGVGLGTFNTVGANTPTFRITPSYIKVTQDVDMWFSFLDDLTFDVNGLPLNFNTQTGPLQRQGYYTWSYCLQRQMTGMPNTEQMTVIVYQSRPVETPVQELVYPAAAASATSLTLTGAPQLRRGNWVMDITATNKTTSSMTTFYRVMEAIQTAGSMTIEVFPPVPTVPGTNQLVPVNQVVVLDSAVEVFTRGANGR